MSGTRGGMGFDFGFPGSGSGSGRQVDPERALRVLVIGDFGSGNQGGRGPVVVEPAEIDRAIAGLGVSFQTSWEGQNHHLRVRDFDGFHPYTIATTLPWMDHLVTLRKRIKDPATSAAGVREASELGLIGPAAMAADSAPAEPPTAGDQGLAGLLGKGIGTGAKSQSGAGGVDIHAFIRKVVGDAVPGGSVDGGALDAIRAIDQRLSAMMRTVLRDPRFARIECAWRAMQHVASLAWDEESVRFEIVSWTEAELAESLSSANGALEGLLRGSVGDADGPVDLVLLVEPVRGEGASVARAVALAEAVTRAGATLILSGDASMVGSPGFGLETDPARWQSTRTQPWREPWQRLIASSAAARVAMAMPRWLARRPYGLWSEPIERFTFEELTDSERGHAGGHGLLSWAGGGWLLLRAIAEAWASDGAEMRLGSPCVVGDLPHAAWKDATGSHALPCAECYLAERSVEAIGGEGFIAAASMKGRDAVVLGPIQSIAGGSLTGRWG